MQLIKNQEHFQPFSSKVLHKFLLKSLLKNILWIFPFSVVFFKLSLFLGLTFLCFVISYTYWEYEKFKLPVKLKLHVTSNLIKWGYNIAVWGFMLLTAYTVGMGIKNNYITDSKTEWFFAVGYSIAFATLLLTLTYMIKTGKKWILLTFLYLLFDIPGAMPFNYLFFYEKLKVQNGFNEDLNRIDNLRVDFGQYIKNKKSKIEVELNKAENIKKQIDYNKLIKSKAQTEYFKRFYSPVAVTKELDDKISDLRARRLKYKNIDIIDSLWTSRIISIYTNREQKIEAMDKLKIELGNVFSNLDHDSSDHNYVLFKERINSLKNNNKTQIEGIQDLFEYISDLFGLKKSTTLTDRDKKFIKMSLLPSVIIDLLPLLFSIVYAKWNNQKDTIV